MNFKVLTREEAAEQAGISCRSLDNRIKSGAGPAVTRIGGSVRIRSDELEKWLIQCTQPRQGRAS